jgi:hypothetical protein
MARKRLPEDITPLPRERKQRRETPAAYFARMGAEAEARRKAELATALAHLGLVRPQFSGVENLGPLDAACGVITQALVNG